LSTREDYSDIGDRSTVVQHKMEKLNGNTLQEGDADDGSIESIQSSSESSVETRIEEYSSDEDAGGKQQTNSKVILAFI